MAEIRTHSINGILSFKTDKMPEKIRVECASGFWQDFIPVSAALLDSLLRERSLQAIPDDYHALSEYEVNGIMSEPHDPPCYVPPDWGEPA